MFSDGIPVPQFVGQAYARLMKSPVRTGGFYLESFRRGTMCWGSYQRWDTLSCYMKLPDGEVVREEFTTEVDVFSPITELVQGLKRQVREKYPNAVL